MVRQTGVLHILVLETGFNSATFLKQHVWASTYVGLPDVMKTYAGAAFTSVRMKGICNDVGINVDEFGIEGHHALGFGQRHNAPLRRILNQLYIPIWL